MKIYTSSFSRIKDIPEHILPVSIARFPPSWFKGYPMKMLAPSKRLLWASKQGKIDRAEYTRNYLREIEEKHEPEMLYEALHSACSGKDIVLLCFEAKGEFCHRRLLAEWLERKLSIEIEEL